MTYVIALVVVIVLICLLAMIGLSVFEPHPTDSQPTVMDVVSYGSPADSAAFSGSSVASSRSDRADPTAAEQKMRRGRRSRFDGRGAT